MLAVFGQLTRPFRHGCVLGIIKGYASQKGDHGIGIAGNAYSLRLDHQPHDVVEVLRMWSDDGRAGESGGFKHVVTAASDQGAADEARACRCIPAWQFTQGIRQVHPIVSCR